MHVTIWVAIITSIISPTLLFGFQLIRDRKKNLEKKINELLIRQLKIELISLLYHQPMNSVAILTTWDEYKRIGGNSYMKELITAWEKKYKVATNV